MDKKVNLKSEEIREKEESLEESLKREIKTKSGIVKKGRLMPIVVHDNRNGPYNIGRNEYKRQMKKLRKEVKERGGDPARLFKRKSR